MPTKRTKPATKAKPKAKPKPQPKPKPKPKPKGGGGAGGGGGPGMPGGSISVRMYRVGFGDCFLVSLPTATGPRYILVDCGVHGKGDIGTMKDIVADIAAVTNRKLAVVIASHAHQDHISGFDKYGPEFKLFQIGEVWLPWTWDPSNPQAVQLQGKQGALAAQLAAHFDALPPAAARQPLTTAAAAAVANLTGNANAIALLKTGFGVGAKVRYLKAKDGLTDAAGITGLTVDVLGPPTDVTFLAQMDPPANQHYVGLGEGGAGDSPPIEPFARSWRAAAVALGDLALSKADEQGLADATTSSVENLAFALDKARNNESVVALFSYQGQTLLFAGDAQYGNWRWWLENAKPDQILPRVRFLKVAHHGSVNATPKDALEKMTDGGFAAMVSTQSTPWASIPLVALMSRLDEKTKQEFVRSDWLQVQGAPVPLAAAMPQQPANPPAGFTEGGRLWFDYVLKP
ncbi:MAG TPA: MBL fold metallo-hydrolase [Candidatus Limnocylindria bacterium]